MNKKFKNLNQISRLSFLSCYNSDSVFRTVLEKKQNYTSHLPLSLTKKRHCVFLFKTECKMYTFYLNVTKE